MKLRDYDPDYIAYAEERGEQIREDRLDDLERCEYALQQTKQRAEELEQILDACEAANYRHLARIDKLEQLCRDMYETMHYLDPRHVYEYYTKRMEELGLLEGEQND